MYSMTYHRPSSVEEAVALFGKGKEAKYLAGGQTLIPVMKQRLAAPAAVMNAITDAIGSEDVAMPATPQQVWAAIRKVRAGRRAAA